MIAFLVPCIILLLAAINPSITINETTIFSIKYPPIMMELFSIFRANGRFIWPVIYCLMLGLIVYVSGKMKKAGVAILLIAMILQVFDLSEYFWRKKNIYMYHLSSLAKPVLMNDVWSTLSDVGYKEIFIFNGDSEDMPIHRTYSVKKLTGLSEYALLNHMVTNDIYCARKDSRRINAARRKEWENIKNGKADETRIYIFPAYPTELAGKLKIFEADGMYIGIARGNMDESE